jgi:hypothetical protein
MKEPFLNYLELDPIERARLGSAYFVPVTPLESLRRTKCISFTGPYCTMWSCGFALGFVLHRILLTADRLCWLQVGLPAQPAAQQPAVWRRPGGIFSLLLYVASLPIRIVTASLGKTRYGTALPTLMTNLKMFEAVLRIRIPVPF